MIPLFKVHMPPSVMEPLREVLLSGYVGQGKKVDEFEEKLRERMGVDNVLTLNSCTSALHLALHLCGVGPGTSVVTTPITCLATNVSIVNLGADIIWADVDPNTGLLDPTSFEMAHDTKAIIRVAWGGCLSPALNWGIPTIEDRAHAFGQKPSPQNDFECYSFQAIKHITTVDGGLLVCKDGRDHDRAKRLRWFGIDRDAPMGDMRASYNVAEVGYKFHMNDVNAAIGIEQLLYIDGILHKHRENGAYYDDRFRGAGVDAATLHYVGPQPTYWLYTLLVNDPDGLMKHLAAKGIQASRAHERNDTHACFARYRTQLPGVDAFSRRQVCIPVGWWVTQEDRKKIADEVIAFVGR